MSTNKLDETASGVFIISATPFTDAGELDLDSTDRLMDFYMDKGVSGITILGVLGEAPKLSADESEAFLARVLKRVNGRVPVIVGVSEPGTDDLARLAGSSMEHGAAGVMVAPVPGLGTEEKLYNYMRQVFIALGDDVPVCYQDFPFLTKSEISVPLFNRLVNDFKTLVMLKHEEWPGLNKLTQVRQSAETDGVRRVSILCGNGGLFLPEEMGRGADGAMTGFAYPEMMVQVVDLCSRGELTRAQTLPERAQNTISDSLARTDEIRRRLNQENDTLSEAETTRLRTELAALAMSLGVLPDPLHKACQAQVDTQGALEDEALDLLILSGT